MSEIDAEFHDNAQGFAERDAFLASIGLTPADLEPRYPEGVGPFLNERSIRLLRQHVRRELSGVQAKIIDLFILDFPEWREQYGKLLREHLRSLPDEEE